MVPLAYGFVALVLLRAFSVSLTPQQYVDRLEAISPSLADWSAWFDATANVWDHMAISAPALLEWGTWGYLALPLVYFGLIVVLFFPRSANRAERVIYLIATFAPLMLMPLGNDYYRWISFACVGAILVGVAICGPRCMDCWAAQRPRLATAAVLPWTLLGPIGAANVARPYPALQFLLERM